MSRSQLGTHEIHEAFERLCAQAVADPGDSSLPWGEIWGARPKIRSQVQVQDNNVNVNENKTSIERRTRRESKDRQKRRFVTGRKTQIGVQDAEKADRLYTLARVKSPRRFIPLLPPPSTPFRLGDVVFPPFKPSPAELRSPELEATDFPTSQPGADEQSLELTNEPSVRIEGAQYPVSWSRV